MSRTTVLGSFYLNTVSQSSIVQMGDSQNVKLSSRVLAIQRAIPSSTADEFRFAAYPIFFRSPELVPPHKNVQLQIAKEQQPAICIGALDIIGISASSFLRAGCGGPLTAESRIKDIRQFNNQDIRPISKE